jgi:hypothetical protein
MDRDRSGRRTRKNIASQAGTTLVNYRWKHKNDRLHNIADRKAARTEIRAQRNRVARENAVAARRGAQGAARGNAQGAARGNAQGAARGNAQGAARGNAQGAGGGRGGGGVGGGGRIRGVVRGVVTPSRPVTRSRPGGAGAGVTPPGSRSGGAQRARLSAAINGLLAQPKRVTRATASAPGTLVGARKKMTRPTAGARKRK